MLLKTVHQWDICNQEDLDTFREESEAIHNSTARTLYRSDPEADPDQSVREEKETARRLRKRTPSRPRSRRRQPGETDEQWLEANRALKEANRAWMEANPVPPVEEPEVEDTAIDTHLLYPSREAFLERLADDLEGRNRRNRRRRIKHDGYCIAVKAIVEHRNGSPLQAEFVETEAPRLAHLPDPNGGRILLEWEEKVPPTEGGLITRHVIEDPDGNILEETPGFYPFQETRSLMIQEDLDQWLLIYLMDRKGEDWEGEDWDIPPGWQIGHRKELTKMLKEQAAKP